MFRKGQLGNPTAGTQLKTEEAGDPIGPKGEQHKAEKVQARPQCHTSHQELPVPHRPASTHREETRNTSKQSPVAYGHPRDRGKLH